MTDDVKLLYGYNNGRGQLVKLVSQNITKEHALILLANQIETESSELEKIFKAINDIANNVISDNADSEKSDFSILWETDLMSGIRASTQSIQSSLDLYSQISNNETETVEVFIV